jgi:hypothetical protein
MPEVSTGREISTNCWYSCSQPSMSTDGHSVAHAVTFTTSSPGQRVEVENWYANTKEVVVALELAGSVRSQWTATVNPSAAQGSMP